MELLHKKPGVIVALFGGLGNQMFMVASAWLTAMLYQVPLYLCKATENAHITEGLNYARDLFRNIGQEIPFTFEQLVQQGILKTYRFHSRPNFDLYNPLDVEPPVLVHGYSQCWPPLAEFEKEICEIFVQALEPYRKTFSMLSMDWNTTAFLHVRRGDYVKASTIHYLQPMEYYKKAYQYLCQIKGTPQNVLLLSDDIDWCLQQEWIQHFPGLIVIRDRNELESLALMSLCKGGAICANSTFSWWGAFLGGHPFVTVPYQWISLAQPNLFPETWAIIKTE